MGLLLLVAAAFPEEAIVPAALLEALAPAARQSLARPLHLAYISPISRLYLHISPYISLSLYAPWQADASYQYASSWASNWFALGASHPCYAIGYALEGPGLCAGTEAQFAYGQLTLTLTLTRTRTRTLTLTLTLTLTRSARRGRVAERELRGGAGRQRLQQRLACHRGARGGHVRVLPARPGLRR